MKSLSAAQGFSAMGSESRLEVLQVLVRAGNKGLAVGDIQSRTGIPASTLAHHLKFLSSAELVLHAIREAFSHNFTSVLTSVHANYV